ncbi:DUF1735 and LamG domain-containing protein [Porphyromonas pogonae]|uniref:DUF1735 and LamG domain-containing protein n=1 Tax=Porphyromonas pogonae TaxID=867595 RepID=UPI002E79147A|nr:DUF1735 and LamG domain-containing protein [Porphyromonas pogonae]
MKFFRNKTNGLFLTLMISVLIAGCNDAEYSAKKDQAYIAQTNTRTNQSEKLKVANENVSTDISVRVSDLQNTDVDFSLQIDEEALAAFNKQNNTNYKPLPKAMVTVSDTKVLIKKGSTFSNPLKITVKPLSAEMKDSGEKYAVAFKLSNAGGNNMAILPGADRLVYIIEPVIVTQAPVLGSDKLGYRCGMANAEKSVDLKSWTVEMRVNMSGFVINNQALFGNWGKDSEIYMRFGDAATPFNTLQVKFGKAGQFDRSNAVFEPNSWYHIAVTYDGTKVTLYINGQKDLDTDKPAGTVFNLGEKIWVASSSAQYFRNACMMSEVRIWNIARSQKQIQENEFSVSPTTPGLMMYWKMDEGKGSLLKNSIKGAPDMNIYNTSDEKYMEKAAPRWMDNIRSDGKGRTKID